MGYVSITQIAEVGFHVIAGSQTIAEVCFHMIANDRRTFCDLRIAIVCDHMETSLKHIKCHLLNVEYLQN